MFGKFDLFEKMNGNSVPGLDCDCVAVKARGPKTVEFEEAK